MGVTADQLRKDGRPTARALRKAVTQNTPTATNGENNDDGVAFPKKSPPDHETQKSIRERTEAAHKPKEEKPPF